MRVVAHRGTRIHAPENSKQALISAYTAGADVLELDVQMTSDGELVVSHDGTIDRLTGEDGVIREMTARRLRHTSGHYDFSATFNPYEVAGFRYYREGRRLLIQLLDDFLDLLPGDIALLLELKHDSSPDVASRQQFVESALDALTVRGLIDRTVVYSKDAQTVRLARVGAPDLSIAAFDWELDPEGQLALLDQLEADGLVTDIASFLETDGSLTPLGRGIQERFEAGLTLGALLYPYRPGEPGIPRAEEFRRLRAFPCVWSVSTDTLLGGEVAGEYVPVGELIDRHWSWLEEGFAGKTLDRDRWALGYAKAHRDEDDNAFIYQNDGIHIETGDYSGWFPPGQPGSGLTRRVETLELQMHDALRTWPYYTGGGVGLTTGIRGDFIAEVDYELDRPLTQATTLEMAVVNVDPGAHRAERPTSFRHKDSFYDPHGAPPFVGVEHDEDDGYRINWNLGSDYDNNQYGPPVGDGKAPRAGRLRLERRGAYFAAYYRNDHDAPDWICTGATRNESMNQTVYLRCAAKRWRQEDGEGGHFPVVANHFVFRDLRIRRARG